MSEKWETKIIDIKINDKPHNYINILKNISQIFTTSTNKP